MSLSSNLSNDLVLSYRFQDNKMSHMNSVNNNGDSGDIKELSNKDINDYLEKEISKLDKYFDNIKNFNLPFPNDIHLKVNKELDQIVAVIVDRDTGEAIKSIPSEEFQRLHIYFKKSFGFLLDTTV